MGFVHLVKYYTRRMQELSSFTVLILLLLFSSSSSSLLQPSTRLTLSSLPLSCIVTMAMLSSSYSVIRRLVSRGGTVMRSVGRSVGCFKVNEEIG